jgi:hypothetical protein
MADLSILQSGVLDDQAGSSNQVIISYNRLAGVALVPGNLVFGDTASLWQKISCPTSGGTAVLSGVGARGIGVVLNSAVAAGQPVTVQVSGPIKVGNPPPAVGTILYGSVNAGAIADSVATGSYVTEVGVVISATDVLLTPYASGVVHG